MSSRDGLLFFLILAIGCVWSENVLIPAQQCPGQSIKDLRERIKVDPCGKKTCKLSRGSNVTVTFRFKPDEVVETLVNEVNADIFGTSLPFIGISGMDACRDVSRADTGEKVSCPLSASEEYIYKIVFPVEKFYPPLSTRVHWSLKNREHKVICFVLPAVII